ncbi:MAG: PcfJ domain-containing protein [Eubacteriales bacterium]|nr:PcfJ domain-containing protein [Eubacteriales bacterium]
MSKCKCDWSAEHTADLFKRITPITHKEEEQMEAMFRTYLIVEVEDRRTKHFYCTSCKGSSDFIKPHNMPELDYDPYNDFADYYNLKHGEQTHCPFCGNSAEIVYAGKMGRLCEKMWQQVKVIVFHAEADGWLSAQAGYATKSYSGKNWRADIEYWPQEQYMFRPHCALQWERRYRYIRGNWQLRWSETATIHEPFRPGSNDYWTGRDGRSYSVIGLCDCIEKTDLRYSAADQFIEKKESGFGLMRYLGEYCHRPQLEMLVKLEFNDILRELIYCHRSNPRLVNWKATDLSGFLRLDKRCTKLFMQSEHRSVQELEVMQMLKRDNSYDPETTAYLAGLHIETIRQLKEAADARPIAEAVRYLRKQKSKDAAQLWVDYIRMAKDLAYDLTEETVFYPKSLKERHDTAAEMFELKADEKSAKRFRRRAKLLQQRYAFSDDEFTILIPKTMHDIVCEGKALHHCVGGYAERHCDGKTTILFLRRKENLEQPYGTIEMSVENVANMIQLRGDHNNDIPRQESKEFIAMWLHWVADGSLRDAQGNPIVPENEETRIEMKVTA